MYCDASSKKCLSKYNTRDIYYPSSKVSSVSSPTLHTVYSSTPIISRFAFQSVVNKFSMLELELIQIVSVQVMQTSYFISHVFPSCDYNFFLYYITKTQCIRLKRRQFYIIFSLDRLLLDLIYYYLFLSFNFIFYGIFQTHS